VAPQWEQLIEMGMVTDPAAHTSAMSVGNVVAILNGQTSERGSQVDARVQSPLARKRLGGNEVLMKVEPDSR
jgi:hypothetical protein